MKAKHIAIGGALIAGVLLLWKFAKAGKNLVVTTATRIHKLTLSSLVIALEPVIQNPTGGAIRIKFPFMQVREGGNLMASTEALNLDVSIPAWSQVNLRTLLKERMGKDFNLTIPLSNLLWLAPKIIGLFLGTVQQIDLSVETRTTAFAPGLPFGGIEVKDIRTMPLKKPALPGGEG